jgi:lipoic acid synthetase
VPEVSKVPDWFPKIRVRAGVLEPVRELLDAHRLNTVCEGALCPNRPECYAQKHVTVLILGGVCTRNCRFCAVGHGAPEPVDAEEPARVAAVARQMGMRHVVVTSVTRDDLPDGGAGHYAAVARALEELPDRPTAEALIPDFSGDTAAIGEVARSPYRVLAHNMETVPRLYSAVRPQADYQRSLRVLATLRRAAPDQLVKSGLMLGLGETESEVREVLRDLLGAGVTVLALGQYLQPTPDELTVKRFTPQAEFDRWAEEAKAMGFHSVAAGPYVRSSYRAAEALLSNDSPIRPQEEISP